MKYKNNYSQNIKNITWIGMALNLFLSALKFFVGFVGHSQAVIADAIHSLSDMITDFAVLIGVKFWEPPADTDHPYGHKKIETFVTLIIGIVLGFVGLEVAYKAITTIPQSHSQNTLWIATLGPLISIIVKEFLYQWTIRVAKQTKSSALIANARHHRSDAISSLPALIAVILASIYPNLSFIDHIGAIIVSVFILKVSRDIIKPAFLELTDCSASQKNIEKIETIARTTKGVKLVKNIRTRKYGGANFVDLHILVDGSINVKKGHKISEQVKQNLISQGPDIIDVVVHIEPFE